MNAIHTYDRFGYVNRVEQVEKDASAEREKLYREELERKDEIGEIVQIFKPLNK
jgi:hypothetical protein